MTFNVLFLCTGNSARSILSESLMNDLGKGRFRGFSAGSHPSGQPHPDGLKELQRRGHDTQGYSSKSWDVFTGGEEMHIVVTVCDNAANEICPIFPGGHVKVHWPAPDPAHVEPLAARQAAFSNVYDLCRARIEALIALPDAALRDKAKLQAIAAVTAT
jgi:arsenate reductase